MRRLLMLAAIPLVLALAPMTASAQGGGGLPCTPTPNGNSGGIGCTINVHKLVMDLGPIPSGICPNLPGGELVGTVSGVFHVTSNRAGDFWITSTLTGSAVIVDPTTGAALFSGHLETWFGQENNNQIGVQNAVDNINGTNLTNGQSAGAPLEMHQFYDLSTFLPVPSPSNHTNVVCR